MRKQYKSSKIMNKKKNAKKKKSFDGGGFP